MAKFPLPPQEPLVDPSSGLPTNSWWRAFSQLQPLIVDVVAGSSQGMPNRDAIAFVKKPTGAAGSETILVLSTGPTVGQTLVAKDIDGIANVIPILFQPPVGVLIDGQPSLVIDKSYGWEAVRWNGTQWSVECCAAGSGSIGPTGPSGGTSGNIDGGQADTNFGGLTGINGGGP